MTSSITARVGRLLSVSAVALAVSMSSAVADTATRAEIEYRINQEAPHWMIDAENHYLVATRLQLPRQEGDVGKACGGIFPVGSPRFNENRKSFKATLVLRDGDVLVMGITTFFMPLEKLLLDPICE